MTLPDRREGAQRRLSPNWRYLSRMQATNNEPLGQPSSGDPASAGLDLMDETLHAIYEASLAPQRWPQALEWVAKVTGSQRALIFTFTRGPATGGFVFAHNFPAEQLAIWGAKSVAEDPFAMEGLARGLVVDGAVIRGDDLVPRDVARRHAAVQEVWQPLGIDQMCCGIVFGSSDAHKMPACVALYRRREDPPFEAETLARLRRLVGHIARSLGVMFHLRDARLQLASTQAALDELTSAVYLLDSQQRVAHLNRTAKASPRGVESVYVADSGALALGPGFRHREGAFRRLLGAAVSPSSAEEPLGFEGLVLDDMQGRPRCVVHAAPLAVPTAHDMLWTMGRGIVFAYFLDQAQTVSPERLTAFFGLTPAEARAALAVLHGGSVAQMAERLRVSENTLKSQLKAVYAKTQTHRQADLLKLLLHLGRPTH